ncbi:MAG: sugar kinase [Xanthobacteraceae bacterium]|nr:sugar kinase [Xanthobacteraceae bacterium]MBX9829851.1 sugar kinase [Xanthobacteraceae bacterium]
MNSPSARQPIVLCAGIAVEDFLFKVDAFPAPGTKMRASDLVATTGGCAANAAVAVARLGGRARFSGPVGTDDASRRFLDALAKTGVDASGVLAVEGGSISVSGIFIDRTGEKMVSTMHGRGLDNATPPDAQALVADIDVLLVDNRFPAFVTPICRAAAARGIPVVLDVDKATRLDDPLFATASHLIFSSEALVASVGAADLGAALARVAVQLSATNARGFLAVTNGPDDVLWLDHGVVRRLPVFKIEAIDTLGAGDTFHGGFALALAEGREEVAAMRFGAAAAALKCTRFGGVSGTPGRKEVDTLLAEHPA